MLIDNLYIQHNYFLADNKINHPAYPDAIQHTCVFKYSSRVIPTSPDGTLIIFTQITMPILPNTTGTIVY